MKNPKFLPIEFSPETGKFTNLHYIPEIANLLLANVDKLFDAFFELHDDNKIEKTIELVRSYAPHFWAIVDPKTLELAGIAYLYDWVGNDRLWFSTKVSTCFVRKYWGKFAHRAGKLFLRYAFAKYRLVKICAEVFDLNPYPKRLLATLGFKEEYKKPTATVVKDDPVGVLGYSVVTNRQDVMTHDKRGPSSTHQNLLR